MIYCVYMYIVGYHRDNVSKQIRSDVNVAQGGGLLSILDALHVFDVIVTGKKTYDIDMSAYDAVLELDRNLTTKQMQRFQSILKYSRVGSIDR